MKGPYPQWDKDMHFVTSHDFFKSAHSKLVSCGNQFEVIGRKVPYPSLCFDVLLLLHYYYYILETYGSHLRLIGLLAAFCYPTLIYYCYCYTQYLGFKALYSCYTVTQIQGSPLR